MASRCCFSRAISSGKALEKRIRYQQEYLVAVIPARKAQPRAETPAARPNAQPAQMRLAVVGVLGLWNKERSCQRQHQQDGAHDHGGSITAGGARLRGVGVHSGVQHGERKACAQVECASDRVPNAQKRYLLSVKRYEHLAGLSRFGPKGPRGRFRPGISSARGELMGARRRLWATW